MRLILCMPVIEPHRWEQGAGMFPRCATAFLAALVVVLSLAAMAAHAFASPLDEFKARYEDGTFLAHEPDYAALYSRSTGRTIEITHAQQFDGRIDAWYYTAMLFDGQPYEQRGVMSLYVEDGKVVREEHAVIESAAAVDLAMAGQAADIGTTAAALGMGFAEGNPAVAALIGTPAGIVAVVGLKLGAVQYANSRGLAECVTARSLLGSIGWGAGAWNIGMVAAGPVAAVVLGITSAYVAWNRVAADSPARCITAV
ncbi:hypothetical protein [Aromatoleum anaerobium]|uniref:Uncharacterized protein n=1 Tax=Aromatoleum anaerobium TaxID=182180 RepID=A0ABX1PIK7_9RHOO|nr:hypothetical protein [Aromatoleum anaerobium]MCK0506151.1 hypothetical protein [Aromatoleum anaerobium]